MEYSNELSEIEKDFLKLHSVRPEQVFDAKGYSKSEYPAIMRRNGEIVAFNTTPCNAAGHKLRTRSGHCIMCNTAPLGFQKRNDLSGYVYVAGTQKGKILKIGFTNNYENRESLLNYQKYGGFDDWHLLIVLYGVDAGKIEFQLHSKVSKYRTSREYFHDGDYREGNELFQCSINKIIEAMNQIKSEFKIVKQIDFENYMFRNLTKK